jgi:hypothetical protein
MELFKISAYTAVYKSMLLRKVALKIKPRLKNLPNFADIFDIIASIPEYSNFFSHEENIFYIRVTFNHQPRRKQGYGVLYRYRSRDLIPLIRPRAGVLNPPHE